MLNNINKKTLSNKLSKDQVYNMNENIKIKYILIFII